MKKYHVGIDIGGTKIKFGLFYKQELIKLWEIETNTENNGENIINDTANKLYVQKLAINIKGVQYIIWAQL